MKTLPLISAVVLMALGTLSTGTAKPTATPAPAGKNKKAPPVVEKPSLYVIGDSTVKSTEGHGQGWGDALRFYVNASRVNYENAALAGRSARRYLREAAWAKVVGHLKPGDFLVLQFGHNDAHELTDPVSPGSLPGTGPETQLVKLPDGKYENVHTYGWYLRYYIAAAKMRGASVIVCSPVPENLWANGKVVRNFANYAHWAKEAAAQGGASFVPLNEIVAEHWETLGSEKVQTMFDPTDPIHTLVAGAQENAACVVVGVRLLPESALSDFFKVK